MLPLNPSSLSSFNKNECGNENVSGSLNIIRGAQFREVGIYYKRQDTLYWPEHARDQHLVILMPEECSEAELSWKSADDNKQRRWLVGQHIIFIEAGIHHSLRWEKRSVFICLCVSDSFINRLALGGAWAGVSIKRCHELSKGDFLISHLSGILSDLCNPDMPCEHPIYIEALGILLATHLLRMQKLEQFRATTGQGLTPSQLRQACAYIDAHYKESIPVDVLARMVGISKDYFARLFKCSTGITPHRYIMIKRMQLAQSLIKKGKMRTSEIASESGFSDQSHLSRCFRKFCEERTLPSEQPHSK